MGCCCVNTFNLCKVSVCSGVLMIPHTVQAFQSGNSSEVYKLVVDFLGMSISIINSQVVGTKLKFNVQSLNEDFEFIGTVYDSLGEKVNLQINDQIYDCVKFKTNIQLGGSITEEVESGVSVEDTVVIQSVIDQATSITGTNELVIGLTSGSTTVTSNAFIGKRVYIERGNVFNPGIDPQDGSEWHTKELSENFITFSSPFVNGEFIYIETI